MYHPDQREQGSVIFEAAQIPLFSITAVFEKMAGKKKGGLTKKLCLYTITFKAASE